MNYTDLPLSELTWVIVDVITNQHDSLILQSHRWTVLTLGGNLMNKDFKLIPTFLKCASSCSSFGRSLLFNEKKNEPRRRAVHSAKYSKSAAGRAEDSIHIAKGYGNHFSFDGLACNPILLNIWQHTPSPLPSNTSRQYHNGRHKQLYCPLTS